MATLAAAATFMRPFPTTTSRQGIEDDAKPLVVASDSTATMATLPSLLPDGSSTTDSAPETVELRLDQPNAAAAAAAAPTRRRRFSVDHFFGRKGAAGKTAQSQQLAIKVISAPTLISAPPRPRAKSNASRAAPAVAVKVRTSTSSFTNGSAFHEHLSDDEEDEEEDGQGETVETVEETADDGLDVPSTDYSSDSDFPTATTSRDGAQLQRAATIDAGTATQRARRAKLMRRVSFSPSTDEAQKAREMALAEAAAAAATEKQHGGFAIWRRLGSKKSKKTNDDENDESHDEEVKPSKPAIRPRRSSLVLIRTHSKQEEEDDAPKETAASKVTIDSTGVHAPTSTRKRRPSISRVNKHTALAQKHARNLEQLVNSSGGLHDHAQAVMVVGGSGASKGKKEKKGDVVSKRNVKKLKKALVDERLAHGIIAELRGMEGPRAAVVEIDAGTKEAEVALSPAQLALQEAAATLNAGAAARPGFVGQIRRRLTSTASAPAHLTAPATATTTSTADSATTSTAPVSRGCPAPQRAICLDCGEAEADRRHQEALKPKPKPQPVAVVKKKETTAPAPPSPAMSPATDMLLGLGNRLKYLGFAGNDTKPTAAEPEKEDEEVEEEDEQSLERDSAAPTPVQPSAASNSSTPQLLGVSTLNLLSMPAPSAGIPGTALSTALDASGAIPALGALSGTVIRATGSNISIHPPLDRMALFIHWWGYEITLPPPTMAYLSTAQSVSGAFLNFLSTMVVTGGVPELTPFIKYISMALDVEFRAIKQADMGKGVVLAATWVIPMALVPRAWDYESGATSPTPSGSTGGGAGGGAGAGATSPSYYKRKVVHRTPAA